MLALDQPSDVVIIIRLSRPPITYVRKYRHMSAVPPRYPPQPATITACPENEPLYATAIWFFIPGVSNFDVCSHCYASHIRQTRWANRFRGELKASNLTRRCHFNTPRGLQLWSEALRYDNWDSITAYWAHRRKIADCQGATALAADVGTKWYHPTYRDIDGFGICAACYEDVVCSTAFAGQFVPAQPGQPAGELWNCKMTMYLRRVMQRGGADWASFAAAATRSLRLPPCTGSKAVAASQCNWFQPVPAIDGLFVCETCYVNTIAASFMEANWAAMAPTPRFSPQGWQTRVCGLSVIALKVACLRATQLKDYALLWRAAKAIFSMPYCAPGGIENGTWHRLRCGQGLDFDVCGQCFAGFIIPYGFGDRFIQMQLQGKRTCDLNPAVPRQREYCRKLDESISLGNFAYFEEYATRFANIPPCPTYNIVKGRRWYGDNTFLACEQCWEEFVRDTPLASNLIHKGIVLSDGAFCDLYSARMRGLWMKACNTGDLREFVAAAQHRTAVYTKTVPTMQQLVAQARLRFVRKETLLRSSVMLHGANNVAAASRMPGSQTTMYGNDRVGWWETMAGAEGAEDWEKANKINIVPGNEMVQVARLEAMWKAVE
jgi:hypothetical protein